MIEQRESLALFGCEVFDPEGQRVGIVGQLFLDDDTDQPAWITVQTGLFGTNESFVPLDGAAFDGDTLTVAVRRVVVRQAPRVSLHDGDLLAEQERALFLHYGINYGVTPSQQDGSEGAGRGYVQAVRLRLRRWAAVS